MTTFRTSVLSGGLLCLALSTFAVAGPGGTYGPGTYGPSGSYGGSGTYGGYKSGYNNGYNSGSYSNGGFGGSLGYGPAVVRTPPVYIGTNRPYVTPNTPVIRVQPGPNTVITVNQPPVKRPYYEGLPGHGYYSGGYKPAVIVQPGVGTRPVIVGGNSYGGRDNYGHYHRPQYYNGGWYHGDWHSNWNNSWKSRPYSWGGWNAGNVQVSGAAVGSPWRYGYWNYSNPYYTHTNNAPAYINYSRPIIATTMFADASGQAGGYGLNPANQEQAIQAFAVARSAFFQGDYVTAQAQIDQALSLAPNDTVMHEFRALVLFATQQYRPASGAIYALLSSGPGWNWTTLIGLYPNVEVYTQQLRVLERICIQNPQASEAHFLLAYHYLTAGHTDAAAEEYQAVLAVNPRDTLSAQLLTSLTGPAAGAAVAQLNPNVPVQQVDPRFLIGNWSAARNDGSSFNLRLGNDGTYRWGYAQPGARPQEFAGTYTLTDNVLVLTQNNQPAMVGQVTPLANNSFNFKLAGGDVNDPGLNFQR